MNANFLDTIHHGLYRLQDKTVTLGFDGFTDTIFKVIKAKDTHVSTDYFSSLQEFGNYITEKGEKNFSLELEEMTTKIGGNMPIMANAIAQFGAKVNCIGSLGYPIIHPVFRQMAPNCSLFSFADPGLTKALEFNGNKMMLAEIGSLNLIEWKAIRKIVGQDAMKKIFSTPDLICMLNWSELDNSTDIWKGILSDVLPAFTYEKKPVGFFDLADCSKRTPESIEEAMMLLKSFSRYWDVTLSLNLNEAILVNSVVSGKRYGDNMVEDLGSSLYNNLQVKGVVIHYAKQALYWNEHGLHRKPSFYVASPKLSTGAGDNFNAGFCAGMLMELKPEDCLTLGHATSNCYMRNAASPCMDDLIPFLQTQQLMPSNMIH